MAEHPATESLTVDQALGNAARLLHAAELETNLSLMERLENLAEAWVTIASWLIQREQG